MEYSNYTLISTSNIVNTKGFIKAPITDIIKAVFFTANIFGTLYNSTNELYIANPCIIQNYVYNNCYEDENDEINKYLLSISEHGKTKSDIEKYISTVITTTLNYFKNKFFISSHAYFGILSYNRYISRAVEDIKVDVKYVSASSVLVTLTLLVNTKTPNYVLSPFLSIDEDDLSDKESWINLYNSSTPNNSKTLKLIIEKLQEMNDSSLSDIYGSVCLKLEKVLEQERKEKELLEYTFNIGDYIPFDFSLSAPSPLD